MLPWQAHGDEFANFIALTRTCQHIYIHTTQVIKSKNNERGRECGTCGGDLRHTQVLV